MIPPAPSEMLAGLNWLSAAVQTGTFPLLGSLGHAALAAGAVNARTMIATTRTWKCLEADMGSPSSMLRTRRQLVWRAVRNPILTFVAESFRRKQSARLPT